MKILLLTQVVPFPPDSGPKIKTYNVLRYLARRHEIHLVSFVRSPSEEASLRSLGRFCSSVTAVPLKRARWRDAWYLARSFVSGRPFLIERDDSRAMREAIDRLVREHAFDAVHADQLSMAQFAVDLPLPRRVLDEHNAVWSIVRRSAERGRPGPTRWLAQLEWRRLRAYEGMVCRRFDRVTVVSDVDRLALEEAAGRSVRSSVIPIAVDTDELVVLPRTPTTRCVVSVATMFYPPNVEGIAWFISEIFPFVRAELPEGRFYVVGSRPPASIAGRATPDSGVVVTGYVPDLDPILREAGVLVVPLHSASGMRVKILEAFARGIPVVATTIGVEGIDAVPGEHCLVADDPREFARAVVGILREPTEAARLARAARALVETRYDWRAALSGLDEVYASDHAAVRPA